MLRKEAKPQELAALLKIKEVREILELHKVNPKESSERISKYQKDLAARVRAHDRGKRSIVEESPPEDVQRSGSPKKQRTHVVDEEQVPPSEPAIKPATPRISRRELAQQQLTGILAQSELAMPPTGSPPANFSVEWIQFFFQSMCSKIPFFPEKKLLVSGPPRTYVEESEDQRIYIDGLSSNEIVLLLNFIYDMETNLLKKKDSTIIVPNKFVFIPVMGDPIDSGLLDKWYFTNTVQCATCGLRYANRKLLTIHHDYHYHKQTSIQRRKRGLENNFRGWMEPPGDWLTGTSVAATAVQFSTSVYAKMDELISSGPAGFVPASVDVNMADSKMTDEKTTIPAPTSNGPHTAKTETDLKHMQDSILPESIPVDEIKTSCLECGEKFEKIWLPEPVDMAVYRNAISLSIGASAPLQFRWPIAAAEAQDLDDDENEDDEGRKEEFKIDANNALFDQRFVNSIFIHKDCYLSNEKLRTRDYQVSILFSQNDSSVNHLLPPSESMEQIGIVQEEDDEDQTEDIVDNSRMIIA